MLYPYGAWNSVRQSTEIEMYSLVDGQIFQLTVQDPRLSQIPKLASLLSEETGSNIMSNINNVSISSGEEIHVLWKDSGDCPFNWPVV